jgi:hypothetical protein
MNIHVQFGFNHICIELMVINVVFKFGHVELMVGL